MWNRWTSPAGQFRFFAAPGKWTLRALSRAGNGDAEITADRGVTEVALSVVLDQTVERLWTPDPRSLPAQVPALVFNAVGGDGQVIVLTCDPDRYAAVEGAHHIELVH